MKFFNTPLSIIEHSRLNNIDFSQLFDSENLNYNDKEKLNARKRIAGAIFETKLDISTH